MIFPFKTTSSQFLLHTCVIIGLFSPVFITRYAREYEMRKLITREEGERVPITVWRMAEENNGRFVLEAGKYRLVFSKNPNLHIGDEIRVIGKTTGKVKIENSYRITLQVQSIQTIAIRTNSMKLRILYFINRAETWRREIVKRLYQTFSPQHADILLGIVIGKDIASDSNLYKILAQAGMLHVAVASGSNIVIIASIFNAVIRSICRGRIRIIVTVIMVIIYAYFTGFDPSILRALLMFSTIHIGRVFGRPVSSNRSFFYTLLLLLSHEPFLIYSASFLLSASATASLLWISPIFLKREGYESQVTATSVWDIVKESFFTSLSVSIFTLPLQMYLFDTVNIISLLSNVLLGFLITPLMVLGMVQMLALTLHMGFISNLIAPLTWVLLEVFIRIINLLATVPYGSIPITLTSARWVVVYDFLLILGLRWVTSRRVS